MDSMLAGLEDGAVALRFLFTSALDASCRILCLGLVLEDRGSGIRPDNRSAAVEPPCDLPVRRGRGRFGGRSHG
ncbi:hypothetical protein N7463_003145 [Penicillium fimorum]|uniref:Uncharacterized protein n=1 Tax=Penicillium fimorum TaxID=1882269 RepID=A0A9W9Y0J4_9EURO|nr:hypothetical protein N7463_003145 [Penicillium fimorum]